MRFHEKVIAIIGVNGPYVTESLRFKGDLKERGKNKHKTAITPKAKNERRGHGSRFGPAKP